MDLQFLIDNLRLKVAESLYSQYFNLCFLIDDWRPYRIQLPIFQPSYLPISPEGAPLWNR